MPVNFPQGIEFEVEVEVEQEEQTVAEEVEEGQDSFVIRSNSVAYAHCEKMMKNYVYSIEALKTLNLFFRKHGCLIEETCWSENQKKSGTEASAEKTENRG